MKLWDANLEVAALYAICSSKNYEKYLTRLHEDHFHEEFSHQAYARIMNILRSHDRPPSWESIISDPTLDEDHRQLMKSMTPRNIANDLLDNLETFRQSRAYYAAYEYMDGQIRSRKIDVQNALRETMARLQKTVAALADTVITDQQEDINNIQMLDDYQSGNTGRVIKTGFRAFDSKNGGVLRGTHFMIAGPSGEGKSALAGVVGLNMAIEGRPGGKGVKVCFVSLEMPESMVWTRVISTASGIPLNDILFNNLDKAKWRRVKNTYLFLRHLIKINGGAFKVFVPRSSMTIEQLLALLRPYDYDVIIIDYLSLLSGFSDHNFWQKLGEAANLCQRYAVANDKVVLSLAQADDDGNVRLSKQLKDNSGLLWVWESKRKKNKKEDARPKTTHHGAIAALDSFDIEMPKARMQTPFTLRLYRRLELMQMSDEAEKLGKEWIRSWPGAEKLWGKLNLTFDNFRTLIKKQERLLAMREMLPILTERRKTKREKPSRHSRLERIFRVTK